MSHWYHPQTAVLIDKVPNLSKPGQYRDATLRDARPLGLLPSVTTVIQMLARPGLVTWQMQQAAEAAWQLYEPERPTDWMKQVMHKADEFRDWTAEFGTAVHEHLRSKLQDISLAFPPIMPRSDEVADGIITWMAANGYEVEQSEYRFARPDLGYAGSVDMIGTHNGNPAIWDIKTTEPPLTVHTPDWPLQLAGYDYGLPWMGELMAEAHQHTLPNGVVYLCEQVHRERISLICNRLVPGQVVPHLWIDKDSTVEDTNNRWNRVWLSLLDTWFNINQYWPARMEEVDA